LSSWIKSLAHEVEKQTPKPKFKTLFDENNTKSHDFTTFAKLKEGATIVVPWEIYQKRKVHTLKETLASTDYK